MGQQCDVSLPQSVSEIVSPDINNQNERPKIPKKSPPPIPPSDEDQKNENDEDENDDKEKDKKSSFASVGFSKSKHLFARAMNRFNGGNSSQNEESDHKENEIDEEMKQLGWDLANGGNLMNVMAPTDE